MGQTVNAFRNCLGILNICLYVAGRGVVEITDRIRVHLHAKNLIPHQGGIFEVHMKVFAILDADNNAIAGRSHRLGKIQYHQPATGGLGARIGMKPEITAFQRTLRACQYAVFKVYIGLVGHGFIFYSHIRRTGVAPPVQRP